MLSVLPRELAFVYLIDGLFVSIGRQGRGLEPEAEASWKTCEILGISSLLRG